MELTKEEILFLASLIGYHTVSNSVTQPLFERLYDACVKHDMQNSVDRLNVKLNYPSGISIVLNVEST